MRLDFAAAISFKNAWLSLTRLRTFPLPSVTRAILPGSVSYVSSSSRYHTNQYVFKKIVQNEITVIPLFDDQLWQRRIMKWITPPVDASYNQLPVASRESTSPLEDEIGSWRTHCAIPPAQSNPVSPTEIAKQLPRDMPTESRNEIHYIERLINVQRIKKILTNSGRGHRSSR